jgi:hypothetical protein
LPSSSRFGACTRAMTSYGPVRLAVSDTPGTHRSAAATARRAHLGLDQNVRRDHLAPAEPSRTIQHAAPVKRTPTNMHGSREIAEFLARTALRRRSAADLGEPPHRVGRVGAVVQSGAPTPATHQPDPGNGGDGIVGSDVRGHEASSPTPAPTPASSAATRCERPDGSSRRTPRARNSSSR